MALRRPAGRGAAAPPGAGDRHRQFPGKYGDAEVIAEYGGVDDDPAINARVQAVFAKVAPAAREMRGELRYEISVLKSEIPNAFPCREAGHSSPAG